LRREISGRWSPPGFVALILNRAGGSRRRGSNPLDGERSHASGRDRSHAEPTARGAGPAAPEATGPPPPPAAPNRDTAGAAPPRRYGGQGEHRLGRRPHRIRSRPASPPRLARYYRRRRDRARDSEATFVRAAPRPADTASLGSLRVVRFASARIAFAVTGPLGGRVFVGDHVDGWGLGGAASAMFSRSITHRGAPSSATSSSSSSPRAFCRRSLRLRHPRAR